MKNYHIRQSSIIWKHISFGKLKAENYIFKLWKIEMNFFIFQDLIFYKLLKACIKWLFSSIEISLLTADSGLNFLFVDYFQTRVIVPLCFTWIFLDPTYYLFFGLNVSTDILILNVL